jgi:GAF domain-containing protein
MRFFTDFHRYFSMVKTPSHKPVLTLFPENTVPDGFAKAVESFQEKAAAREKALAATVDKIRRSLDIDTIFTTTVQEVRQLLQAERVAIYRFAEDWSGEFVAESMAEGWKPLVGVPPMLADTYLQETQGGRYRQNQSCAVDDVYQAGLKACHVALLEQFQAKAFMISPILQGEKLWGLLAAYQNSQPRQWQQFEVDWLAQIGAQMGIALQQSEYLQQMQRQAAQLAVAEEQQKLAERLRSVTSQLAKTNQRQRALTATVDKIRCSLDLTTIFQTTTQELRHLLKADRAVIYRFLPDWSGEFVAESVATGWMSLMTAQQSYPELTANISDCSLKNLDNLKTDTYLKDTRGGRFAAGEMFRVCPDIYQAGFSDCYVRSLESYQAKAYAIFAIYNGQKLWGLLAVFQNAAARQWQNDEVDLLSQIGAQLSIAIQQAESVQRVKEQAAQLQVQAAQLEKSAERQRALVKTVDKIRQSLDIDIIFQTTTQEVRQLLEVERVAIYRFYPDWSGEFVADSIADGWQPASRPAIMFGAIALAAPQSGQYPRHETFVPILQGEKLWGLLMAYQTSQPRFWQEDETNLLAQVGAQLGVALQQAELWAQTTQQSEELTLALKNLQASQSQLIQGEKMAGLGQLVAGVAHEINNPVNFIHGNLSHVEEYTQDLLAVMQLYKQQNPIAAEEKLASIDLDFVSEDLPKTIKSMKIGTERICQIVTSLRNFSRHDEADMKPVDIHEGIDSTLLILQHRLKATSDRPPIQAIKEFDSLPLVECYPAQLNQVFMNILSNGIDALEESCDRSNDEQTKAWQLALKINSKLKNHAHSLNQDSEWVNPVGEAHPQNSLVLRISTERVGTDRVLIRISDNAFGMPEEVRARIFDPFFTTKPIGKGTGLGLSISHQIIVDKHQGEFECVSQPGEGTEFRITVPIRQG